MSATISARKAETAFFGPGLWHPDGPALQKVRDRIVDRPGKWKEVVDSGIAISGDALKRPPAGYDPAHPFIADLALGLPW